MQHQTSMVDFTVIKKLGKLHLHVQTHLTGVNDVGSGAFSDVY